MKKLLVIVGIVIFVILLGCAGDLDHHEYIEVNSTRQTRMPFYYEK